MNRTIFLKKTGHFIGCMAMIILIMSMHACVQDAPRDVFQRVSPANTNYRYLLPYPNEIIYSNDEFTLGASLCYSQPDSSLVQTLEEMDYFYKGRVEHWQRRDQQLFSGVDSLCTNIIFIRDTTLAEEAYELAILDEITIRYHSGAGAFYGLQSLRQIIQFSSNTVPDHRWVISKIKISDHPRFGYRGIHLDAVNQFYPVDEIKRFINILSQYKINTFHWQLSDGHHWNIESKIFPQLNTASAPSKTPPNRSFYYQREIRDIVRYAQSHFIQIIPEIDLPCPTDTSYSSTKSLLQEVLPLFPGSYVHIGGSNDHMRKLTSNSDCLGTMGLQHFTDGKAWYNHYMNEMIHYLKEYDKSVIGWNELLKDSTDSGMTILSMTDASEAIKQAKKGISVIIAPDEYCNLAYRESLDTTEPPSMGGYLPLKKVYTFNPVIDSLDSSTLSNILGTQGYLYTEYMPDFDAMGYSAFPRSLAIAENGWTENDRKDWRRFSNTVNRHLPYLRYSRFKYSRKLYEPQYQTSNHDGMVFLSLFKATDEGYIKYWSTRSNSERLSVIYQEPIQLTDETNIRLKYFSPQKFTTSNQFIEFKSHKASGRSLLSWNSANTKYQRNQKLEVILNGIIGHKRNAQYNREWKQVDMPADMLIDLGDSTEMHVLKLRFIRRPKEQITGPDIVQIAYGMQATELTTVPKAEMSKKIYQDEIIYRIAFKGKIARFVQLQLKQHKVARGKPIPKVYIGEIELR